MVKNKKLMKNRRTQALKFEKLVIRKIARVSYTFDGKMQIFKLRFIGSASRKSFLFLFLLGPSRDIKIKGIKEGYIYRGN